MVNDNFAEKKQLAAELVCNALADLNEKKGASSLRTIRKYIGKEYKLPPNVIDKLIIPQIQNGVQFGVITNHLGRYQLSSLMDNIVDLACKRKHRHQGKHDGKCDGKCGSSCNPCGSCGGCGCCKRKCNRSSKNFRRIDYKSADVCYQDKNNRCGESPKACQPCCGDKEGGSTMN